MKKLRIYVEDHEREFVKLERKQEEKRNNRRMRVYVSLNIKDI